MLHINWPDDLSSLFDGEAVMRPEIDWHAQGCSDKGEKEVVTPWSGGLRPTAVNSYYRIRR